MYHILDIVLSSQPHTIKYVTVIPGMSDREAVIFEVLTKLCRHNSQPRKVYLFHNADQEAIIVEANKFMESFFQENPYDRSIHKKWYLFQMSLSTIIENYVPSKVIRPHKDVPCLTHHIKQKMKTCNKIYI